ncbi:MAG TPA: sugar phosphate isomerase/epimerase family protein [Candidatus Hydrogenedentes bacterium]|nr:sugar phosphate isomerase/epimerase family protein [Candidatus Hydrogenedentota bacterium]
MKKQSIEQIGVCSWSLQATGPRNLAEKVNALGLKKVQMGLTPHRDDPGAWDGVQEILAESGIQIVSGMYSTVGEDYTTPETIRRTGGVVPDEHWEENLELAKVTASIAEKMGITYVNAHAGFLPHDPKDPDFEKLSRRVLTLAEVFGGKGVSLLMETGQETAQTLLAFLGEMKKLGAKNIWVNFDPANMILYDMDNPIEALRLLAPHVRQVHVKDAKRTKVKGQWGEEVIVGMGEVDWEAFVRILAEADFDGGYIFEREAGDNRVGDIKQGIMALSAVIRKTSA